MKYRSDIDGLRAIAILLVLVYHGGLALFPSGFIGVDVFFVISGYLITTIIHRSLNENNFSFIDFYNRRLWRLQPVLVCLIVCTTLLGLAFFLPEDLIEYSRSARKTSLFISNLFFKNTTTGYFSSDSHQLPLLHTWSLSIEWQCYLILPFFVYCLHRLFNKTGLFIAVFCCTLLSLWLSWHYSTLLPAQTYYQFSSRIFEFLIGSCIALISFTGTKFNKYVANCLAAVAITTILYIATLDDILLGYPNGYAFLVCFATGILIILGSLHPTPQLIKWLSLRPLVFIGMLSYSLYIWHWAVFASLRYQSIEETPLVLLSAYTLSFILAYISWRYVEKPARQLKQIKLYYTIICLLIVPILITHSASYFIKRHNGYPQRFNQELVHVYQQLAQYNQPRRPLCISNAKTDAAAVCTIGMHDAKSKKALMIGDSFSNHYWGFMDTLGQDAHVSILAQATSSCITLPDILLYDWWYFKNQVYQECREQTVNYYRMIAQNHYDFVIIGQIWSNYLSDSIINRLGDERSIALTKTRITHALDNALVQIISSGAKPVLIKNTALMQHNTHDCFFKHIKLKQAYEPKQCDFTLSRAEGEEWFDSLFATMQLKYPELVLIDPKKVQCKNSECRADINGIPVYRDAGHITDYASYQLGRLYLRTVGNPLN